MNSAREKMNILKKEGSMLKLHKLLPLMLILLLPLAFAVGTESNINTGGTDSLWNANGSGDFATIGDNFDTFGKNLNNPQSMPVVSDIDKDEISDLILVDDDKVKLYQNKELDLISTLDFGDVSPSISNILLFDIDGDNEEEIIFAGKNTQGTTDELFIINFTVADGLVIQRQIKIDTIQAVEHPIVACTGIDECLVTITSSFFEDIFSTFTHRYRVLSFDSTNVTGNLDLYSEFQASSNGLSLCSPRIKSIPTVDYDGDGNKEFIVTIGDKDEAETSYSIHLFYLDNLTIENGVGTEVIQTGIEPFDDCTGDTGVGNMFTPASTADIRDDLSDMETYIGVQSSTNKFKILVFDETGTFQETFPEFLLADGVIISNAMIGNFFPETLTKDVCVLGFNTVKEELDLLCGTEDRGSFILPDSDEFVISVSNNFNISTGYEKMDNIAHGSQHSDITSSGNNLDEIINAYGIFRLDFGGSNQLAEVFNFPQDDVIAYSIDFERKGLDDIIVQDDTNIIYYDDRLNNEPAQINDVGFNPCIVDELVKVNTSVQFTINAQDNNNPVLGFDDLNFKTFVYFGTDNQQNETILNVSTSQVDGKTSLIQSFIFNQTGNNKIFRVEVFDTANPSEIDIFEQLYSVATNGVQFGETTCTTQVALTTEQEVAQAGQVNSSLLKLKENNAGIGLLTITDELLGLGAFAGWIAIMIIVALVLFLSPTVMGYDMRGNFGILVGFVSFIEILFLIIGVIIGAIPLGALIFLAVLGIVIVAIMVSKAFQGSPQ